MATPVAPPGGFQNGAWYGGQQYWNGQFGAPGVIINPNQPGTGQPVSAEVNNQTNPKNNAYIASKQANPVNPVSNLPAQVQSGGGGGGGGGVGSIASAPTFDLVAATNAAYNTPEITAATKAITDANTELTTRQQALAEAQNGINDNPFYSEATRVGKSQQLTQQANNDMSVIQTKITQAQNQAASLKADAAIKVNAAQGQYNINEQVYKDNLTNFNNLLSQGALDNASGSDIANLAVQTGIPTSMIQSMVGVSQKKNNPVQLVQSTDSAGNLNLIAVDSTGKIVNTTTIPGAGKGTDGSGAKAGSAENLSNAISVMAPAIVNTLNSYGNISPQDWQKALAVWLGQGLSKDDFIKNFGQYADLNRGDFQSAYGFANPKK